MANTFLIKHGSSAPTSSNLQSYELGFSTSTNSLYLNNGSAILRFQNSDQIENKFLQLSGGTLTGTLNGTSIVCTGNITAPNFIGIASSANATNANSNVCDIAKGYNYDTGELHINYECATTGKPILKYIFRDGNKGYSSIYCKNLETSGTITSTGSITATGITSTDSITATSITSTGRITGGENIIATGNIETTNGFLISTANGNTLTIGSQNATAYHFISSINVPFYFNNDTIIKGNIYPYSTTPYSCGTSTNPWTNTYTTALTLNGSAVVDYIIGKGWSGDWFYHIYKSGFCEAWCYIHLTNVAITNAWGNIYESNLYRPPENLALSFSSMRRITIECAGADSGILSVEVSGWEGANYPAYFLTSAGSKTVANVYLVAHASGYNVVP